MMGVRHKREDMHFKNKSVCIFHKRLWLKTGCFAADDNDDGGGSGGGDGNGDDDAFNADN
jgi:hypothetical protein